jgi:Zn ribbon nucleic-acid-binding protein
MSQNRTLQIEALQSFEKPDTYFLKDKECLICLETLDLEMNVLVKLPCGCANSAYHIPCIIQLLESGDNKNFCPHCKTKYTIRLEQRVTIQQVVPLGIAQQEINRDSRIKNNVQILIFHLLINSIMNIISIYVSRDYREYNKYEELHALLLFYFLKVFCNFFSLGYSKNNIDKIENILVVSYVYQTTVSGLLIYTLAIIKNSKLTTVLLTNNLILVIMDVAFRAFIECGMNNRVIADL